MVGALLLPSVAHHLLCEIFSRASYKVPVVDGFLRFPGVCHTVDAPLSCVVASPSFSCDALVQCRLFIAWTTLQRVWCDS